MLYRSSLLPAALLLLIPAVAPAAAAERPFPKPESYDVELAPVGGSEVTGIAHLVLRGDRLTVLIRAFGLEPSKTHPVILHGFPGGRPSICPDAVPAVEEDDQRFAPEDARAVFGHGLVGLDPSPRADLRGVVEFEHSYDVAADRLDPLARRSLVLYHETGSPLACGEIRGYPEG